MPQNYFSSGSAIPAANVVSPTTTYPATGAEDIIRASGAAFTVTLASATTFAGKVVTVQKTDASLTNIITVSGTGLSTTLNTENEEIVVVAVGGSWVLLSRSYPNIPVAYTPTFTGFGTVSSVNIKSYRDGAFLCVAGNFTSGTSTTTEARMTLGFGGTNGNVTVIAGLPTVSVAGVAALGVASANGFFILTESSVGYVTFGMQGAGTGGAAKRNGDDLISTGNFMSMNFRVQISGWN